MKKLAAHGALFQTIAGITQLVIRLASSMVLARVLTPEDFGVFALATLTIGVFSQLSLLGATQAIIIKKNISQVQLSTAFLLSFIINTLLFFILLLSSSYIEEFYNTVGLQSVIQVLAFIFLFKALSTIPNTLLIRNMKFLSVSIISIIAVIVEMLTAIVLVVYFNYNYWGLVWGLLFAEMTGSLFLVVTAKWYPLLVFRRTYFFYLLQYGYNIAGENIAIYLRQNIDYFLIGKLLDASALGIYSFAYRIPNIIYSRLLGPASGVIIPAMSNLKNNKEIIHRYLKFTKYLSYASFPMLISIFLLADPLISILWGDQWGAAIVPMKVLVVVTTISVLALPMGSVFLKKNRPDLLFKISVIKLVITFFVVLLFGSYFGLLGIAYGMAISALIAFYVNFQFLQKIVDVTWLSFFFNMMPLGVVSLITFIINIFIYKIMIVHGNIYTLFVVLPSIAIIYASLFILLFNKEWLEIKNIIQLFGKSKNV